MKILVALLATLCCSIAFAGTITLDSQSCNSTTSCYNIQNDAGLEISYLSFGTSSLSISLYGTTIYGRGYLQPIITTTHLQDGSTVTTYAFENVVLDEYYGGVAGTTVTLSIVATEVTKPCVQEGKVCIVPRKVTLDSGTLVTP